MMLFLSMQQQYLVTVDMVTIMNGYRKSGDVRLLGEESAFLCASRLKKLFKVSGESTRYVRTG